MTRLVASIVLVAAALPAQLAKKANEGYQTPEARARVARGLDAEDREERQKPRELLAAIDLKAGQTVADIGSGPGFMAPYFLEVIGPTGKVYAEDIQQDFLDQVKAKIKEHGWTNVETVLGGQVDPKLPAGEIDLAFILDAYHHFEKPLETLANVRASLAPGGRLAVIDFYRSRPHPTMSKERLEGHIREDRDGFAVEIEKAGFTLIRHFDHLPHQYVLLFEKSR
jgi:predicted methyltransferase